MVLMESSVKKKRVKKVFIISILQVEIAFGSFRGLSKGSIKLLIIIAIRINPSNILFGSRKLYWVVSGTPDFYEEINSFSSYFS
jgi:hypothetical protein